MVSWWVFRHDRQIPLYSSQVKYSFLVVRNRPHIFGSFRSPRSSVAYSITDRSVSPRCPSDSPTVDKQTNKTQTIQIQKFNPRYTDQQLWYAPDSLEGRNVTVELAELLPAPADKQIVRVWKHLPTSWPH